MGVPVLTRRGARLISHNGETIAHNSGQSAWVAEDNADYVAKAAAFGCDLPALARLRQGLRAQVLASPMFDAERFARHFEEAMRGLRKRHIEDGKTGGSAPQAPTVDHALSASPESNLNLSEKPMTSRKLLNVGGNSKKIPLPSQYAGFEHWLLDIDPAGSPDILCDARTLDRLDPGQFDVVYCSHNLEHYHRHDVRKVLSGFMHVLKDGGVAHIRVPDIQEVMRLAIERGLDLEDVLYQSSAGPIMVLDVIYGYSVQIERSGEDFYAHKTGFTQKSLIKALQAAGFSGIYSGTGNLEVQAFAFKGNPDVALLELFKLPSQHGIC
jgi:SAM-dependent methyltransferase